MAIRNIRTLGDEILRKKAKEITEMTPRDSCDDVSSCASGHEFHVGSNRREVHG